MIPFVEFLYKHTKMAKASRRPIELNKIDTTARTIAEAF